MVANTASAQGTPPAHCTTPPAGISEEAKVELQAQCATLYKELTEAAIQKAKVDSKTAGLTTTIPNAPTGAITTTASNDKYPTILAAAALSYAGNVVGTRICNQARLTGAANLVVGLPSDYRRAQTQKLKIKSDSNLIILRINHKAEVLKSTREIAENARARQLAGGSGGRIRPQEFVPSSDGEGDPEVVPNEVETSFAADVASTAGILTGVGNAVNSVANMFQSDVTITPVAVSLSDKTLMTAIKRGVVESRCPILTPEFTSNSFDPFTIEQHNSELALNNLKGEAVKLLSYLGTLPIEGKDETEQNAFKAKLAKIKLDTQTTVQESENQVKSFWNSLYSNQVVQVLDPTTKNKTDVILPSVIEEINISDAALSGGRKHFIGAKIVTSAATHIQSKGLFRSDRLHYTGSVVVEYEVVDQFGTTQISGLFDASMADLVKDKDGFTPTFGIVDNPHYLRPNPIGVTENHTYHTVPNHSIYRYEGK